VISKKLNKLACTLKQTEMKKLIFILPVFLMTSCIKKIVENTLGEVKDRQCECTYTASGKTEKKESTTIKK